jgi:hypothetical protein
MMLGQFHQSETLNLFSIQLKEITGEFIMAESRYSFEEGKDAADASNPIIHAEARRSLQDLDESILPNQLGLIHRLGHSANGYGRVSVHKDDAVPDASAVEVFDDELVPLPTDPFNLAIRSERNRALESFNTLNADGQQQIIQWFHNLIDNKDKPGPRIQAMTHYKSFSKEAQADIFEYYKSKHKATYYTSLFHSGLGYVGELFYLWWDLQARMTLFKIFAPESMQNANIPLNAIATLPITVANITYSPKQEARNQMEIMMIKNTSFIDSVFTHKFLAAMFGLYAFGGGYIEIVDIEQDLEDKLGPAKWVPIIILMYAAIAYYTIYNFADTLDGIETYRHLPSLAKNALNPFNGISRNERITSAFSAMHEFLSLVERTARMSYGGFESGRQQLNTTAGIVMASAVGFGTSFVALGTRVIATRKMYNRPFIRRPESDSVEALAEYETLNREQQVAFNMAEQEFNNRYYQARIWNEFKLFCTPTLFLVGIPGIMTSGLLSQKFDLNTTEDFFASAGLITSLAVVFHALLGLREPAKSKEIIRLMEAASPGNPDAIEPNALADWIATVANSMDQGSRVLTIGYSLMQMLPMVFNTESEVGRRMIASSISFAAFIALSAYRYQKGKVKNAITIMFPQILSTQAVPSNCCVRFFRQPAPQQIQAGANQDEQAHDESGLLNRSIPQSDESEHKQMSAFRTSV